jgi:diguanylate cyclase (GGDEF)-like protein
MDDIQPIHNAGNGITHVAVDRHRARRTDTANTRERDEAKIYHLAHHDALTGLANRALFLRSVEEALASVRRHGDRFNTLVLDLDQFKVVNDTLGHPVGDALLQQAAARLRQCTRETDIVARLGGDEFAILQRADDGQEESALGLARRLLAALREPYDLVGNRLVVGTGIGIALPRVMATRHRGDMTRALPPRQKDATAAGCSTARWRRRCSRATR